MNNSWRFNWQLPPLETSMRKQLEFCAMAEDFDLDSLVISPYRTTADSLVLALAMANHYQKINFVATIQPGLRSPTLLTQQVNTFSVLTSGRIGLHIQADTLSDSRKGFGDFSTKEVLEQQTEEFLIICKAFWESKVPVNFAGQFYTIVEGRLNTPFKSGRAIRPEIFVEGDSAFAKALALSCGDYWIQSKAVETMDSNSTLDSGYKLKINARGNGKEMRQVVDSIMDLLKKGSTNFFLSGTIEDLEYFGRIILPILKNKESLLG